MILQRQENVERRKKCAKLLTNVFTISVCKPQLVVHVYKLRLVKDYDDIDAQYQYKLIGNRILRQVHRQLTQTLNINESKAAKDGSHLPGSIVINIFDNLIYSTKILNLTNTASQYYNAEEIIRTFDLTLTELSNFNVKLVVTYSHTTQMTSSAFTSKVAFSVLQHQPIHDMMRYNQTFYLPFDQDSKSHLNLLLDTAKGIYMSGVKEIDREKLTISMGKAFGAFVKPKKLIELLKDYFWSAPTPPYKRHKLDSDEEFFLSEPVDFESDWFRQFSTDLLGLKCQVRLPHYRISFKFKLSNEPACNVQFFWQDQKKNINIVDFYRQKYDILLKYKHLPCLVRPTASRGIIYYPLELCWLVEDKIARSNVDAESEKQLTRLSSSNPSTRYSDTCKAREELENIGRLQMDGFGIKLSPTATQVDARVLERPTLLYGSGRKTQITGSFWEMGPFYKAAGLKSWRVVVTTSVDFGVVREFTATLVKQLAFLGFSASNPKFSSLRKEKLTREKLEGHIGESQLVLFIIDSDSTKLHRMIHDVFDKSNDETTAICVRVTNIRQRAAQVVKTLVQKINCRLKGTNVTFDSLGIPSDVICPSDLMVVGLDVTHPDREMKIASIAGCTYTYGPDLFRHKSLYGLQKATQELIDEPKALFTKLLLDFVEENGGKMPKHVVVYRDGVSDSQFEQVRQHEINMINEALIKVAQDQNHPTPSLSFVVVQKRHTTRLFGFDRSNKLTNPPCGTIVDSDIVTSGGEEFYLFSHSCNRSTARPTHYRILANEMLSNEQLQQLTYSLCFNFGKCTTSLTIPTTLRYADTVAFEAREQLLATNFDNVSLLPAGYKASRFFC